MKQQVSSVCRSTHHHLKNIGAIRKFITKDACIKLIHALITTRIDYANSLLYGVPDNQLKRLQRILNIAARIITLSPPSCSITPILFSLHWLPIKQRINYKILLLTFRALHDSAPEYLQELLTPHKPSREGLRSVNQKLLAVPDTKLKTIGDRSFSASAPKLWNSIPLATRSIHELEPFKTAIKTHLFIEHYNCKWMFHPF